MVNNLTPCQQLCYQEGELFVVTEECFWYKGSVVVLERDDRTNEPLFGARHGTKYTSSKMFGSGAYDDLIYVSKLSDYFEDIFHVSETEISLFSLAFGLSIEEAKSKIEEAIELKTIWNEHKGILK